MTRSDITTMLSELVEKRLRSRYRFDCEEYSAGRTANPTEAVLEKAVSE
ncbi:hypothetical protein [Bifidobacterium mongoliense]|uniref:Uncharacterized protein n=1 Tax=Bifidobacterium mongoliense DSM 21395 TaxID=1437603 RepID=A0A087BZW0_9BIFI|nr:hypothetical protein [Bifidobacterium mongoliense]KFI76560.1 hypothetical protein BMON_1156 [Bifidobacterium mongoliense DSM 21395]